MPFLNGGQALMNSLAAMGADAVLGVPGAGQYEAVDALWSNPDIRYISVRHEQEASFMADAYSQVSGRPPVVLVVPGPGLLYAGAGLASAFANSTPLFAITSVNSDPLLRSRQLELLAAEHDDQVDRSGGICRPDSGGRRRGLATDAYRKATSCGSGGTFFHVGNL